MHSCSRRQQGTENSFIENWGHLTDIKAGVAHLLIEFGVWGALVNEQFDDVFISLPGSQVEGVAALIVSDVGQGLVSQQRLHHLAVKCEKSKARHRSEPL